MNSTSPSSRFVSVLMRSPCLTMAGPLVTRIRSATPIAEEMGVAERIRVTSGPAIVKQGDLMSTLTNLEEGDVLFIDEIHRLNKVVEEFLYPAMEDYQIDIMIGQGPAARSIKLPLKHFTLIGATTRSGL